MQVNRSSPATLASGDGSLVLSIPGGAVNQPATFQYAELARPSVAASSAGGRIVFMRSFELTAARLSNGAALTQFSPALQLTVSYTPGELGAAGIASPEMLRLYYQDASGAWVLVPSTLDPAARTLTAPLDHFTVFAVGGETFETAGATGALYFTDDLSDASAWQFSSGNGSVSANTVTTAGAGNTTDAFTVTNSDELTDYVWQARVRANNNSSNLYSGLMFRWQSATNFYGMVLNPGRNEFALYEVTAGNPAARGGVQSATILPNTWYWIRVTATGNVLNGVLMDDASGAPGTTMATVNYTDPSPKASGRVGIGNFNVAGSTQTASFQSPTLRGQLPADWGSAGITQVTGHTGLMWNAVTAAAPTATPSSSAGTRSIQLFGGDFFNEGYVAQTSAAVSASTTYEITGWIRTNNVASASTGASIVVRQSTGTETMLGGASGTTGWTKYTTTFTTDAATSSVDVRLWLRGSGTANFDNISVISLGPPTPTPTGVLSPSSTPTPVPASDGLYGEIQTANTGITNAANSIVLPRAFDGVLASKGFNGDASPLSHWTWTSVEDTTLTSVTIARIELRWYVSNYSSSGADDVFKIQYSVTGGASWIDLVTYPTAGQPPSVITTSSFTGLESVINTPALANAVQIRFVGAGTTTGTTNDNMTLFVDQVRLIVGNNPPTATPSATATVVPGVQVTPASGGASISQDTNSAYGSGAWTSLTGPIMNERATGDMVNGATIVLTAPSGFEFNTASVATRTVSLIAGTLANCFTVGAATMSATTIAFNVTAADSAPGTFCRVTFGGIQVRPTAGAPVGSFTITNTGTQLPGGTTNYGTLTKVTGAIVGWQTYNAGCAAAVSTFDATNNTACAKGTAPVTTAGYYQVVWYDGAGAIVISDSPLTGGPTLQSGDHALLACCGTAAPGTWHVVVYPNAVVPEGTYAGTSHEIRANAVFTVTAAALPALPTPLSALLASGGAGALYAYFRRRLLGVRVRA